MTLSDVVIHVNQTLDAASRRALENRMREVEGVISPRFSDRRTHWMVIAYDADQARMLDLVEAVEHQGYSAQSCGGI